MPRLCLEKSTINPSPIAFPTRLVPAPRGVMESPASMPAQMTALASSAERGKAAPCGFDLINGRVGREENPGQPIGSDVATGLLQFPQSRIRHEALSCLKRRDQKHKSSRGQAEGSAGTLPLACARRSRRLSLGMTPFWRRLHLALCKRALSFNS